MRKIIVLNLILLTFLSANINKEVLLLHSYHKGYTWSDNISKAIENSFSPLKNIELTTLYMDTKKVDNSIYLEKLAHLYKEQLSNRKFDLIIASDNSAFEFAIKYHDYLFSKIPVLFCGINNFDRKKYDKEFLLKNVTGVVEQVDLERNFKLILDLQPDLKKLVIINDRSKTGLAIKKDLSPIIRKYSKKILVEYVDNIDIKSLEKKVSNLDSKSAILFVLLFKDKAGKYFTYKQSLKHIRTNSSVPIYGLWDFYLDHGIIGGLLTSAQEQGKAVANMALKVLSGKKIQNIPILEESPNRYIFDYKELKKFNFDISSKIENYKIINEPSNFIKEHTNLVVITVSIIITLLIMILAMKANIQRRKKVEKDLQNRIKFDKVLLNTLPNPIYYKNKEGRFLGCNKAFCKLLNVDKKDVIGKTAKDFFSPEIAKKNEKVDEELLQTLGTNTAEVTLYVSNNHMKHIIINKAVYLNDDSSIGGIVCIMDDITERIQQKQFLIQQSKLAEMGDMVAAIAHQWNEPLVELSAQIQDIQTSFLLNELKDIQVKNFVNDSMVQIKYMSQTLSDFRNFLKPSTKKVYFSVKKAFNEIFEIIGKQIFYSNINFQIKYHSKRNPDILVFGYENEFKQVLLNLINNAKNKIIDKKTDEKHNITIKVSEENQYTNIQIIDDGGEIPNDIIDKIFDPYFTTKKDGTGFGLYMAKVIIEDKMDGKIKVENQNDSVIFTLKLPNKKGLKDENTSS